MTNLRKILLSIRSLSKNMGYGAVFAATKFDYHIQVLDELKVKKVLVLSPHPDDDVFGLGGTIKKIAGSGGSITAAYFCDSPGEKMDIRRAEAKKSAEILGIGRQVFFGYKDGKLAAGSSVVRALKELISDLKPDIIFTPSFLDNHPDHRATNEVLINALSDNNFVGEIWAYEVWTPLFANRLMNINSVLADKKKAVLAHESQIADRGYDKAIFGLNQYRAEINNISGYAEAFFAAKFEVYKKLYQKS